MVMKFRVSDYLRSNGAVWKQVACTRPGASTRDTAPAMHSWCIEQFGPLGIDVLPEERRWSISLDGHSTYYFRNPRDCTAFLLRWS
jgi:hypothetical protein